MARLETQINQIYITSPENKKSSLILYEEQLTNSLQLFIVAELWNMQKKSEAQDLKKISEIILKSFRGNKKLAAETLFEASLSQINQNLADLAHEGKKSWVGKFSCLICIKGLDNNIFLANNGQTSAWLKRRSELTEVLPSEKRGNHPLKTFVNFTQGKLADKDYLILTTSNIFSYISFELFTKMLDQMPLDKAVDEISKILQSSLSEDVAFSSFLLSFSKEPVKEVVEEKSLSEIYAPLPEEETVIESIRPKLNFSIPKIPAIKLSLPSLSFPALNWEWTKKIKTPVYFQNLSKAGKFFFISFTVCLLLFLINLAIYAGGLKDKKTQNQIRELVEKIDEDIAQVQSALIYKDENQALEYLNITIADLDTLQGLSPAAASELTPRLEQMKTAVNKINTLNELTLFLDLKRHPTYLASTPIGFLFGNEDSNSLSRYDKTVSDYFLLNSLDDPITSIDYTATTGVIVASGNSIFRIDPNLKQFEPVVSIDNADLSQMLVANNSIYTLDRANDQIVKINYSNRYQRQVSIAGEVAQARDFGADKDFYVLFPDRVTKYVSGKPQAFPMPNMTDPLSNGDKILVASNLYILEGNKKRLIILNKNGALINQIYFPTATTLTDFYVDESTRSLYLLDDNKLYKITI